MICFLKEPPVCLDPESRQLSYPARKVTLEDSSHSTPPTQPSSTIAHLLLAVNFFRSDIRIVLLTPYIVVFSLNQAVTNSWLTGGGSIPFAYPQPPSVPVKKALGLENIAYAAAVEPAVACLLSLPLSRLSKKTGKCVQLIAGTLTCVVTATVIMAVPLDTLVSLGWGLVSFFALSGINKAVYEGRVPIPFSLSASPSPLLPSSQQGCFFGFFQRQLGDSIQVFVLGRGNGIESEWSCEQLHAHHERCCGRTRLSGVFSRFGQRHGFYLLGICCSLACSNTRGLLGSRETINRLQRTHGCRKFQPVATLPLSCK